MDRIAACGTWNEGWTDRRTSYDSIVSTMHSTTRLTKQEASRPRQVCCLIMPSTGIKSRHAALPTWRTKHCGDSPLKKPREIVGVYWKAYGYWHSCQVSRESAEHCGMDFQEILSKQTHTSILPHRSYSHYQLCWPTLAFLDGCFDKRDTKRWLTLSFQDQPMERPGNSM